MDSFEKLLSCHQTVIERFVRFRIPGKSDADDVLQETYLAAYQKFNTLNHPENFKPWILTIARNKCNDYFRRQARRLEISLETLHESVPGWGRCGRMFEDTVQETLDRLGDRDRQMLYLYYFKELPQMEIAKRLGIPLGTVKSRLYHAKNQFREAYPYPPCRREGGSMMKKFPKIMPEYRIEKLDLNPFSVRCEELNNWMIVPKLGEKEAWAMYDFPERTLSEHMELEVVGKAEIHGITGVEIRVMEYDPKEWNSAGGQNQVERTLYVQLTDTHCRFLAESHKENGVKRLYTYLDGDAFLSNWGYGEDNCGTEVALSPKGDIVREGNQIRTADKPYMLDIVGRYRVTIGNKSYDTVCVIDIDKDNPKVVCEQYLDRNGRTVLWRRFNHDEWEIDHYKKRWSEALPDNEQYIVNGEVYVHWYDCLPERTCL